MIKRIAGGVNSVVEHYVLAVMLLAVAVAQGRVPLTVDELKQAVEACVKPQFVAMNLQAIDHAAEAYG